MFVEIDEAQNWYTVALDGLRHLETALHAGKTHRISESTLDQIQGMSRSLWEAFLKDREDEHEMFASLAVLSSFEGEVRRDAAWRGDVDQGQLYFQRFHALAELRYAPMSKLIETWEAELTHHGMRVQLTKLRQLYTQRNIIAHGRAARGQFAFEPILAKLQEAHRKWREFVPDFGRY